MIIDQLLSTPKVNLSTLTTSAWTTLNATPFDFGVEQNNGLNAMSAGPGWNILGRAAGSTGAATLSIRLITSAAANLGSPVVLWSKTGITLANVAKLAEFLPVPDTNEWLRYAAFQAQAGTEVFNAGTLEVVFAAMKRNWRAYPAQGNT